MIHQRQCFQGKHGRHVAVMNSQEIVAILLLATEGQVGRPAVNNGIGAVEAADDKLVMYLMSNAADVANLVKGRGQLRVDRLSRHQDACSLSYGVQENAARIIGNSVTENVLF